MQKKEFDLVDDLLLLDELEGIDIEDEAEILPKRLTIDEAEKLGTIV